MELPGSLRRFQPSADNICAMSYTYLLDLYTTLQKRTAAIETELSSEADSWIRSQYHAGRRDCLKMFHSYLLETFDAKLPRRLQQNNVNPNRNR